MNKIYLKNFFLAEGKRLLPELLEHEVDQCVSNTIRFRACGMEEDQAVHRALCSIHDVQGRDKAFRLSLAQTPDGGQGG